MLSKQEDFDKIESTLNSRIEVMKISENVQREQLNTKAQELISKQEELNGLNAQV